MFYVMYNNFYGYSVIASSKLVKGIKRIPALFGKLYRYIVLNNAISDSSI